MIEKLLQRLGLESLEVHTYLLLLEHGPQTAGVLSKHSGIIRATQYVYLKRLVEKGFVTQSLRQGKKLFSAASPEKIVQMYDDRIQQLQNDEAAFQKMMPSLTAFGAQQSMLPRFEIFEGVDGVKNVLKDMLLYRDMQTYAYWPIKTMIKLLGAEFFHYHNTQRIQRNVFTHAIWPKSEIVNIKTHPYVGSGEAFLREIRIAPQNIQFQMGYWIYGNKVAFLSSQKECFGYIIESAELVQMLLSQWKVIWAMSKKIKTNPKDVESFLQQLR